MKFSRRTLLRTGAGYIVLRNSALRGMTASTLDCLPSARQAYPPLLERFIAKLDPEADDFPCEVYVIGIEKVLASWRDAWCSSVHDHEVFRRSLSTGVVSSLQVSETNPIRTAGPLRIERLIFHGPNTRGVESVIKSWATYLTPLASLDLVELQIYGIRVTSESPLRVETEMRCDLVASDAASVREQRVGSWNIGWAKAADGQWTVEHWTANPEVRSQLTGPGFNEITSACLASPGLGIAQLAPGIDHWRTTLDAACGIDVYGNHGIAVGDIDNSGFDSFYVCQPSGSCPTGSIATAVTGPSKTSRKAQAQGFWMARLQLSSSTSSIAAIKTCWWFAAAVPFSS